MVPDHPAQPREEQKRECAPGCEWAEGGITEIADHRSGRWHESRRRQNQKNNGDGEKQRGQSLSGHLLYSD